MLPKRTFIGRRTVSIPTCEAFASDTVMAVAADSHCDFLTPERTVSAVRPTRRQNAPHELRLFFLSNHFTTNGNGLQVFFKRKQGIGHFPAFRNQTIAQNTADDPPIVCGPVI